MALVEGLRGPDRVRFCVGCQEFQLQLVGQYYDHGSPEYPEPNEFSHIGPYCPVCIDKIEKGEIDVGEPPRERVASSEADAQPVEAA